MNLKDFVSSMGTNTNFKCDIVKTGIWNEERNKGVGSNKWMFKIEMKENNPIPTLQDEINFLTGLLEAEWRNDNYKFKEGHSRPPKFKESLEAFEKAFKDIKNEKGFD